MDAGEHIRLAREMLTDSVWLETRGNHRLAAEAVWGATIYAVEACQHRSGLPRHGNFGDKESFVAGLTDPGIPSPAGGWQRARNQLHNHFYTNRLSDAEAGSRPPAGDGPGFCRATAPICGAEQRRE